MSTNRLIFVLLSVFYSSSVHCLKHNPDILIIGSGPSGIAAATRLWKANFTNLKILEAEPRIGGRVNSVKFGDAFVDLGGEWCHGEKGNIVYDMVKQYDILKHTNTTFKLVYSNGVYIDDDVRNNLLEFYEAIEASEDENPEVFKSCKDLKSTGECFDKEFTPTFERKFKNDPKKLNLSREAIEWLQSYIGAYESSFSLYDVSRQSNFEECEGDPLLNWNGRGYKTILEVMMQKFPDPSKQLPIEANILLSKEVSRIIWNNTRISVQCSDNSSFEADHVIFTPSLGVLKANHESLFEPELPSDKVKAITTTGFGAIMKIILHFPVTWWNSTEDYGLVWSTEDKNRIASEFGKGPVKNGKSWLTTISGIVIDQSNPKVLILFFSGDMIPDMEKESDQVLTDGCMYMLRKFFGKIFSVVDADKMIKTTWYSNPHFRGTYSYDSIKGNSAQFNFPEKLGSPLLREDSSLAVQFAGEATHPYFYSTVHGAIETGYREADRLIKFYAEE